jgi:PAS domain S-box-containing protein
MGMYWDISQRRRAEQALQESEKKLRAVNDSTRDAIILMDRDGNVAAWNRASEVLFGYASADALGKNLHSLIVPERFREAYRIGFEKFKTSGQGAAINTITELQGMKKDGAEFPIELSLSAVELDGTWNAVGVIRDITERKRAEDAIRQQAHELGERVKELNCLYGISRLIAAPDSQLEKILEGTVDLLPIAWQYPEVTCAQLTFEDQVFRTENFKHTAWTQSADIVVHGEKVGALDVCYLEEKPEEAEGPFLAEERDLISVVAERMGRIIETKQAEDKLIKNQYYLTKAQEIGIIGTWELDIQKDILRWTDENYKIFGVPLGTEMNTELFQKCIHPDDRDYVNEKWNAGLNHEPFDTDHRIIVNDEVKWVREKANIEFDAEGNPILAIGFTQDITERKRSENELAKALKVERRQAVQMANELDLASKIQSTLMESSTITMDGLEMTASWVPAKEMSGDFYSLQPLDDHRLGMWVGDVSAKGVPAGLLMVMINAYLHSEMLTAFAPGNVLRPTVFSHIAMRVMGKRLYFAVQQQRSRSFAPPHPPWALRSGSWPVKKR